MVDMDTTSGEGWRVDHEMIEHFVDRCIREFEDVLGAYLGSAGKDFAITRPQILIWDAPILTVERSDD